MKITRSDGTRREVHASVTTARIADACRRRRSSLDNPGICVCCGVDVDGVEPDANEYDCEACGEPGVYGCEELLLTVAWG